MGAECLSPSLAFQSWPIASGGVHAAIVRHVRPTRDGDLLHQSCANRILLVTPSRPPRGSRRRMPAPGDGVCVTGFRKMPSNNNPWPELFDGGYAASLLTIAG